MLDLFSHIFPHRRLHNDPRLPGGHALGSIPDSYDDRDLHYSLDLGRLIGLPETVDLRSHCSPVRDQGQLGCHDATTEVLTERGWQAWPQYDGGLLATVNPLTHALEFQAPLALQRYEYDGPLYYSQHRSVDFALTPNHRLYARRWNERARTLDPAFEFREVQDIGWYAGLLAAPSTFAGVELERVSIGRRPMSGDDFLALIALVASDGWVGGTEFNHNRVSFCCFRPERRQMVAEVAARLGFSEVPTRPGVWLMADPELAEWFRQSLFVGPVLRSPHKRVPDIVKTVSARQVEHFLRFFGDQSTQDGARSFFSASPRMIDDLQELLLRIGKRGSIYSRAQRTAQMADGRVIQAGDNRDITLVERQTDQLSLERKDHIATEPYKGEVFCATVPNSTLITRRNGSVLISGNSCTGFAITALREYLELQQLKPFTPLSPLFLYYEERSLEGTIYQDAGAMIRDGFKVLANVGVAPEAEDPYNVALFTQPPSQADVVDAGAYRIAIYSRVPNLILLRAALSLQLPAVLGFLVFESFEQAPGGRIPVPGRYEQLLGGHAVMACGYEADPNAPGGGWVIFKNSWGVGWGDSGYGYLPYRYLQSHQLTSDIWTASLEPTRVGEAPQAEAPRVEASPVTTPVTTTKIPKSKKAPAR